MLKKRIRKLLQAFVLGDDADKFVTDIVSNSQPISVEYVSINLDDGDILVFPSSLSDEDFKKITSLIPSGKRIVVAASDGVSVIRLS